MKSADQLPVQSNAAIICFKADARLAGLVKSNSKGFAQCPFAEEEV